MAGICIFAESKTELSTILNVFNAFLTEYGMMLSADKSFWVTLGGSIDKSDREAIQLLCGPVKYTESFKYLGVKLTSDLTHVVYIDAQLSHIHTTFTSLLTVLCSTALPVKLHVKLF